MEAKDDDFVRLGSGASGVVGYYPDLNVNKNICFKLYNKEMCTADENKQHIFSEDEQQYVYLKAHFPERKHTPPVTLTANQLEIIDEKIENYDCELSVLTKLKGKNNIVQLVETYELLNMILKAEMRLAIVMEQMPTTLEKYLSKLKFPCLSTEVTLIISRQFMCGLTAVHAARIAHLDFKPANLLFNPDTYELKICDFGHVQRDIPENYHIVTPNYRPIEVYKQLPFWNFDNVKLIDIWSAGCVIYELAFGRMFVNKTDRNFITKKYILGEMAKLENPPGLFEKPNQKLFREKILLNMICDRAERLTAITIYNKLLDLP